MRTYCTLFDRNYLLQAVALHDSLQRWAGDFRLYALCMDDTAYRVIKALRRESLLAVSVDELLTEEIAAVRARVTHGQFCWVCQPLMCQFVLSREGVDMVTYLEADSLFFSSPDVLFEELGEGSVTVVPHRFSPGIDNSAEAGKFCVQFNAFRNDLAGRRVLEDWKACCFRYDKHRRHYYPGQICLDSWPGKFTGVVEIANPGAGVAPWNVRNVQIDNRAGVPRVDGVPVVFYHYHQYGRREDGSHELGSYPLSTSVIDCFYRAYVDALRKADVAVRRVDPSFGFRRNYTNVLTMMELLRAPTRDGFAEYLDALKRRIRGRYNIYPDRYFAAPPTPIDGK